MDRPGRVATTLFVRRARIAGLIAIFGVLAALNTPADIFPSLNIPVVSVVWTDNGLLPNDMSGREPASLAPEPGRAPIKFLGDGFRRLE